MPRPNPRALVLLWALLGAAPATALQVYERAQIPSLLAARPQLKALAPEAVVARLKLAVATSTQDPLRAEADLAEGLRALSGAQPDAETRALVQQLARYTPQALSTPADPDHGRGTLVPLFEVAAIARGTLRSWELRSQADELSAALHRGDPASARTFLAADSLRALPDAELDALLLLTGGELPPETLPTVLERRSSLALYQRLLQNTAPDATALVALSKAAQRLATADALQLLPEAAQRPAFASTALLALAPLSAQGAQSFLISQLGNTAGGSAAQALAQDATALPALSNLVRTATDGPVLRRALLALSLSGSEPARAVLREFAADAQRPAELRHEVAGWLP